MAPIERRLLDDGEIVVDDVRCEDHPPARGPEERARRTEVVIPLRGVFVRLIRRSSRVHEELNDPTRIVVFGRTDAFQVEHPLGGGDRSLVIGLPDDLSLSSGGRPVLAAATVLGRRLAAGLRAGTIDALEAAEAIAGLVGRLEAGSRGSDPAIESSDVRATRLAVAADPALRATLPELGRRVGRSGFELARRFRRSTGTSIHRYRTGLRVQAALERIEAGERDLTGLALDLGFADHSHLTSVLRREAGAPPSAFRRAASGAELRALRTILQARGTPAV